MVNTNEDDKSWHQDHAAWVKEVEQWQHESNRLVALLYQLERALPEHTGMLAKHVLLIEQHEKLINSHGCSIAGDCHLHSCSELKSQQQQTECYQNLSHLHDEARQEHVTLKKMYSEEMDKFKSLLRKLLKEC